MDLGQTVREIQRAALRFSRGYHMHKYRGIRGLQIKSARTTVRVDNLANPTETATQYNMSQAVTIRSIPGKPGEVSLRVPRTWILYKVSNSKLRYTTLWPSRVTPGPRLMGPSFSSSYMLQH